MNKEIQAYNRARSAGDKPICERLNQEIDRGLPKAESKIWHGHPVWFLDGNPIVGYDSLKNCVRLLFWSGQSFDEAGLEPEGKFKAAEIRYTSVEQVNTRNVQRWLKKARVIQWDYKNIVKRRGVLEKLTTDVKAKPVKAAKTTSAPKDEDTYKNGQKIFEQKGSIRSYYFKNGVLKAKGKLVDSLMQGKWIFNRESGDLWQIGNFKDNEKHGLFVRYDRDGNEEYHATFANGKLVKKL